MTGRSITLARAALAGVALMLGACAMFAKPPATLDYARSRAASRALYRGSFTPAVDPIPVGRMHAWTLHIETADGQPVNGGTITVGGGMPQHGHGLPTKPRVTTALGGGDYRVEGMKFNMGGWWQVKFAVAASAGADTLVFNLKL